MVFEDERLSYGEQGGLPRQSEQLARRRAGPGAAKEIVLFFSEHHAFPSVRRLDAQVAELPSLICPPARAL